MYRRLLDFMFVVACRQMLDASRLDPFNGIDSSSPMPSDRPSRTLAAAAAASVIVGGGVGTIPRILMSRVMS